MTWADMLAELNGQNALYDVAEMSDGTVFLTTLAGLYKLSGEWTVTELARLEGCALSVVTADVEAVAAPSGSDADAVAWSLHPDGWALAFPGNIADEVAEVWQYSAGTWALAATGDLVSPIDLFVAGGTLYVVDSPFLSASHDGALYALRGSALTEVDDPWALLAYRYGIRHASGTPENMTRPALFRGSWYTADIDLDTDRLRMWRSTNDPSVECVATMALAGDVLSAERRLLPRTLADRAHCHTFADIDGTAVYWLMLSGSKAYSTALTSADSDTAVQIINGNGTDSRVWAVGASGAPLSVDTLFLIQPSGLAVHDVSLEWRELETCPSAQDVSVEWSTGAMSNFASVQDVSIEWGEGTGANAPTVHDVSLEWMAQALPTVHGVELEWGSSAPQFPSVQAVVVEWSTGSGATAPSVQDVSIEWGAGAMANFASAQDVTLEWSRGPRLMPSAQAVDLEWAMSLEPDGGAGEGVLWLTVDDDDRPAVAVRVVTDWDMADEAELRCLVRADAEALDVDAWGSYESFRPGANYYLETPGHELRIGIVGPLAQEPPHVRVDVLRVDE